MYITEMYTNDGTLTLSTRFDGKFVEQSYMFYSKREAYKSFREKVRNVKNGKSNDYEKDIFAEYFKD